MFSSARWGKGTQARGVGKGHRCWLIYLGIDLWSSEWGLIERDMVVIATLMGMHVGGGGENICILNILILALHVLQFA